MSATLSCNLILSSRVKESNKKAENKCFLLIIRGGVVQHTSPNLTGFIYCPWTCNSEEGPFESELNYRQSWVLSISREFLDSWYTSKWATAASFQILKVFYSWSSSHLILQYITSATETSSHSRLQIIRHILFLLSKLLLVSPFILRIPNPKSRDLKSGRQIIRWTSKISVGAQWFKWGASTQGQCDLLFWVVTNKFENQCFVWTLCVCSLFQHVS